jgi:type I restriction enzyme S subunit
VLLHSRNIKKVARPDFRGITGEKLFILRPKEGSPIFPDLLPFLMQSASFHAYAESRWAGSTNKFLNKAPLLEYEFVLPSLGEQRRYCQALLAAQRSREALLDVVEQGAKLRDSLLTRLIPCDTLSHGDSEDITDDRGVQWKYIPLGERYEVALGKMLSPLTRSGDAQVPYLRNANVQWGRLDLTDVASMSIQKSERERYSLKKGDILACEGRHVGKSAIWNNEIPGACYQKALHRLRPHDPKRDLPQYLLLCLRLYSVSGRFVREIGETTIPHLPAERLRSMKFPFPSLEQQRAISEHVAQLDRQLQMATARAEYAKRVLDALVSGVGA